jgi:hypothetical protein
VSGRQIRKRERERKKKERKRERGRKKEEHLDERGIVTQKKRTGARGLYVNSSFLLIIPKC